MLHASHTLHTRFTHASQPHSLGRADLVQGREDVGSEAGCLARFDESLFWLEDVLVGELPGEPVKPDRLLGSDLLKDVDGVRKSCSSFAFTSSGVFRIRLRDLAWSRRSSTSSCRFSDARLKSSKAAERVSAIRDTR